MASILEFLERVPGEYKHRLVDYINFLSSCCVPDNNLKTTMNKKRRFKDISTSTSTEEKNCRKLDVYTDKKLTSLDIVQLIKLEVAESNARVDALTLSVEELRETIKFEVEQMFSNLILKLVKEYDMSKKKV
jgi:hypothetical protein